MLLKALNNSYKALLNKYYHIADVMKEKYIELNGGIRRGTFKMKKERFQLAYHGYNKNCKSFCATE